MPDPYALLGIPPAAIGLPGTVELALLTAGAPLAGRGDVPSPATVTPLRFYCVVPRPRRGRGYRGYALGAAAATIPTTSAY